MNQLITQEIEKLIQTVNEMIKNGETESNISKTIYSHDHKMIGYYKVNITLIQDGKSINPEIEQIRKYAQSSIDEDDRKWL